MKGCRVFALHPIIQRNKQMIHAKVIRAFGGLDEGRITELNDADFAKLEERGYVVREDAKASETIKKTSDKKANTK